MENIQFFILKVILNSWTYVFRKNGCPCKNSKKKLASIGNIKGQMSSKKLNMEKADGGKISCTIVRIIQEDLELTIHIYEIFINLPVNAFYNSQEPHQSMIEACYFCLFFNAETDATLFSYIFDENQDERL